MSTEEKLNEDIPQGFSTNNPPSSSATAPHEEGRYAPGTYNHLPLLERYELLRKDIEEKRYPEHIDVLNINDKLKRIFYTYECLGVVQPGGFMPALSNANREELKTLPKGALYKIQRMVLPCLWLAIFTPIYQLFVGLWRKALVYTLGMIILGIAIEFGFLLATGDSAPDAVMRGIGIGAVGMMCMVTPYDRYRLLIKKEKFWW